MIKAMLKDLGGKLFFFKMGSNEKISGRMKKEVVKS